MSPVGGARQSLQDFQDEVRDWLEELSATRPDLQAKARDLADPHLDPWGYLTQLGELLLVEA